MGKNSEKSWKLHNELLVLFMRIQIDIIDTSGKGSFCSEIELKIKMAESPSVLSNHKPIYFHLEIKMLFPIFF